MKKVGLVLEGGGLRGIFTAGVIDFFLDKGIEFDYVVGASAGACNTLGYLAKKRGFVKQGMTNVNGKDAFFGVAQMVDSHKYVNLDRVFLDYAEKYELDYDTFLKSKTKWDMVVSNIETGKPEYKHENKDVKRVQTIGIASCSLPLLTFPVELDGKLYLDGGITDSIPIERAEEMGCEYNVVIATRRKGHYCHLSKAEKPAYNSLYGKKYPKFLEAIYDREERYKKQVSYIEEQAKNKKVVLIRPTLPEAGRLEKDTSKLELSYYHGYAKAQDAYNDILELMKK